MNRLVHAASLALGFLGWSCLTLAPGCRGPIEVQKGDLLLHAAPAPPVPAPQAQPQPAPGYHPE